MLRTSEWLLGYSRWLLECYYVVAKVIWMVARVLLRYPGQLLGCFYMVARVLWVVAKVLLCR